ncbi:MAG: SPOR domain-containing protein [Methylococcales bacterium]
MARDYKYRAQEKRSSSRRTARDKSGVGFWKWMLITALLIGFAVFLAYLSSKKDGSPLLKLNENLPLLGGKSDPAKPPVAQEQKKPEPPPQPAKPQFDFYTILPSKEVVVPDYEIKTRAREERVGKAKEAKYILQAGSFKDFKEADQLRAKLALMGIESRVEKTKVGNVTWSRVKLGPYARMSSVSTIRERLRQNGIDVVVTETGG